MSDDTFKWVIAGGVILAALSYVVMAIATLVMMSKLKAVKNKVESLADRTEPILEMVKATSVELIPKIRTISADAVEITKSAREQVARMGEMLTEFRDEAKAQVAKIDGAVESTVGSVQHAGESVRDAVLKPVREVNGVLAGIRTALSVYSHGRRESVDHATQDEEMFI